MKVAAIFWGLHRQARTRLGAEPFEQRLSEHMHTTWDREIWHRGHHCKVNQHYSMCYTCCKPYVFQTLVALL